MPVATAMPSAIHLICFARLADFQYCQRLFFFCFPDFFAALLALLVCFPV